MGRHKNKWKRQETLISLLCYLYPLFVLKIGDIHLVPRSSHYLLTAARDRLHLEYFSNHVFPCVVVSEYLVNTIVQGKNKLTSQTHLWIPLTPFQFWWLFGQKLSIFYINNRMYFPKKGIKMSAATHLSLMLPLHMWWGNRGVLDHTSDVDGASSI